MTVNAVASSLAAVGRHADVLRLLRRVPALGLAPNERFTNLALQAALHLGDAAAADGALSELLSADHPLHVASRGLLLLNLAEPAQGRSQLTVEQLDVLDEVMRHLVTHHKRKEDLGLLVRKKKHSSSSSSSSSSRQSSGSGGRRGRECEERGHGHVPDRDRGGLQLAAAAAAERGSDDGGEGDGGPPQLLPAELLHKMVEFNVRNSHDDDDDHRWKALPSLFRVLVEEHGGWRCVPVVVAAARRW